MQLFWQSIKCLNVSSIFNAKMTNICFSYMKICCFSTSNRILLSVIHVSVEGCHFGKLCLVFSNTFFFIDWTNTIINTLYKSTAINLHSTQMLMYTTEPGRYSTQHCDLNTYCKQYMIDLLCTSEMLPYTILNTSYKKHLSTTETHGSVGNMERICSVIVYELIVVVYS